MEIYIKIYYNIVKKVELNSFHHFSTNYFYLCSLNQCPNATL